MAIIDTIIVFKILKMLVTPFNKFDAFKFGLIDKNGLRLKEKTPSNSAEESSINALHRLVFNLKRIIQKVPFGKTAFASYAIAIALLKEECKLSPEETEQLCEKFYTHIKEDGAFYPTMLDEVIELDELHKGNVYNLKRDLEQGTILFQNKTPVHIVEELSTIFGVKVYVGYVNNEHRVLVTSDDLR
jgi:hypothetical protein